MDRAPIEVRDGEPCHAEGRAVRCNGTGATGPESRPGRVDRRLRDERRVREDVEVGLLGPLLELHDVEIPTRVEVPLPVQLAHEA
jgi:hypothetical protein